MLIALSLGQGHDADRSIAGGYQPFNHHHHACTLQPPPSRLYPPTTTITPVPFNHHNHACTLQPPPSRLYPPAATITPVPSSHHHHTRTLQPPPSRVYHPATTITRVPPATTITPVPSRRHNHARTQQPSPSRLYPPATTITPVPSNHHNHACTQPPPSRAYPQPPQSRLYPAATTITRVPFSHHNHACTLQPPQSRVYPPTTTITPVPSRHHHSRTPSHHNHACTQHPRPSRAYPSATTITPVPSSHHNHACTQPQLAAATLLILLSDYDENTSTDWASPACDVMEKDTSHWSRQSLSLLTYFIIALAVLLVYVVKSWYDAIKLPPGPVGLPLVGYIPFMKSNIAQCAVELSKRYGSDVISVRLGRKLVVFLNSRESIHEAYVVNGDVMSDRPDYLVKRLSKGKGILSSDGLEWKHQRRVTHTILREFAAKPALVAKIHEEMAYAFNELERRAGKPFNVHYLLRTVVTNVICSMVFGRRYDYNDENFVRYLRLFYENIKNFGTAASVLLMMPFLRFIPGDPFKFQSIVRNQGYITDFFDAHVKQHEKELDENYIRDFIDGYLVEVAKGGEKLDREQLHAVIGDLFKAGAETVSTTLRWGLLYLITNPHIQDKIHKEIDGNLPVNRLPNLHDQERLPYTQACLLEIMRLSTVSIFGAPHTNHTCDVIVQGKLIPRDTIVMSNYWAVNMDEKVFQNARSFDPGHFYDKATNSVINQHQITPFGIGRRFCLGDSVAKAELFIILTSLLQRFTFSLPPGAPLPTMDGYFSIIRSPVAYELCASPRMEE